MDGLIGTPQTQYTISRTESESDDLATTVLNTIQGHTTPPGVVYVLNSSDLNPHGVLNFTMGGGNLVVQDTQQNYYFINPNQIVSNANFIHQPVVTTNNYILPHQSAEMSINHNHMQQYNAESVEGIIVGDSSNANGTDFQTEVIINTESDQSMNSSINEQSVAGSDTSSSKTPNGRQRQCDICNKILCNKDSLRRHRKLVHNVELDCSNSIMSVTEQVEMEKNTKCCKCDICNKNLSSRDSLRRHKRVMHKITDVASSETRIDDSKKPRLVDGSSEISLPIQQHFYPQNQIDGASLESLIKTENGTTQHVQVTCIVPNHVDEVRTTTANNVEALAVQEPPQIDFKPLIPSMEKMEIKVPGDLRVNHANADNASQKIPGYGRKKTECESCKKVFSSKLTYEKHKLNTHGIDPSDTNNHNISNQVQCNVCSKLFFDYPTLRRHQFKIHGMQIPPGTIKPAIKSAVCQLCKKRLYDKGVLRRHLKTIHKVDDPEQLPETAELPPKKYVGSSKAEQCYVCQKFLYDKGVLRRHLKHIHQVEWGEANQLPKPIVPSSSPEPSTKEPRPVKLPNISPSINSAKSLSEELGLGPPPLIPGLSSSGNNNDEVQEQHQVDAVTEVTPTPTSSEPKRQKTSPSKHKATVHSKYPCPSCEEKFSNSSNLRRHQVLVHKMKLDNYQAVIRQYQAYSVQPQRCEFCSRMIIGRSNLMRHQKTVHGIECKTKKSTHPFAQISPTGSNSNNSSDYNSNSNAEQHSNSFDEDMDHALLHYESDEEGLEYSGSDVGVEDELAGYGIEGLAASLKSDYNGTQIIDVSTLNHINNGTNGGTNGGNDGRVEKIGSAIGEVFELNEVVECVAKIKEEGLEGQLDNNNVVVIANAKQ